MVSSTLTQELRGKSSRQNRRRSADRAKFTSSFQVSFTGNSDVFSSFVGLSTTIIVLKRSETSAAARSSPASRLVSSEGNVEAVKITAETTLEKEIIQLFQKMVTWMRAGRHVIKVMWTSQRGEWRICFLTLEKLKVNTEI